MLPSNKNDSSTNLLRELENLQKVLDGANEQVDFDTKIPTLEPIDDIPVLNELFDGKNTGPLKSVAKAPAENATSKATPIKAAVQQAKPNDKIPVLRQLAEKNGQSGNPFLPQAVLDKLNHEREAAQHSAEEAHRTMQKVMEQKQQRAQSNLTGVGKEFSDAQKDLLINQLVDEMLPQIAQRLRDKLKIMLSR